MKCNEIDKCEDMLDGFNSILDTFIKIFFKLIFGGGWIWLFNLFEHGIEDKIILEILWKGFIILG